METLDEGIVVGSPSVGFWTATVTLLEVRPVDIAAPAAVDEGALDPPAAGNTPPTEPPAAAAFAAAAAAAISAAVDLFRGFFVVSMVPSGFNLGLRPGLAFSVLGFVGSGATLIAVEILVLSPLIVLGLTELVLLLET